MGAPSSYNPAFDALVELQDVSVLLEGCVRSRKAPDPLNMAGLTSLLARFAKLPAADWREDVREIAWDHQAWLFTAGVAYLTYWLAHCRWPAICLANAIRTGREMAASVGGGAAGRPAAGWAEEGHDVEGAEQDESLKRFAGEYRKRLWEMHRQWLDALGRENTKARYPEPLCERLERSLAGPFLEPLPRVLHEYDPTLLTEFLHAIEKRIDQLRTDGVAGRYLSAYLREIAIPFWKQTIDFFLSDDALRRHSEGSPSIIEDLAPHWLRIVSDLVGRERPEVLGALGELFRAVRLFPPAQNEMRGCLGKTLEGLKGKLDSWRRETDPSFRATLLRHMWCLRPAITGESRRARRWPVPVARNHAVASALLGPQDRSDLSIKCTVVDISDDLTGVQIEVHALPHEANASPEELSFRFEERSAEPGEYLAIVRRLSKCALHVPFDCGSGGTLRYLRLGSLDPRWFATNRRSTRVGCETKPLGPDLDGFVGYMQTAYEIELHPLEEFGEE